MIGDNGNNIWHGDGEDIDEVIDDDDDDDNINDDEDDDICSWNSSIHVWFWLSVVYITYEFSNTKVIGARGRPDLQSYHIKSPYKMRKNQFRGM